MTVKYNDIVSVKRPNGKEGFTTCEAKVNWVENGNVGVTYLAPKDVKGACSVVRESDLTLISASAKDEMAERIASIDDKELEEHIMSIRRRRYPKEPTTRKRTGQLKVARGKKESFNDLFKLMDENPKTEGR